MNINRNNYEAFLLDLLEGRLSLAEERELNRFLKDHPEYAVDFPDIDLFSLEYTPVYYSGRDQLKKEFPAAGTMLSDTNFDMFSIARMEGDLNPRQEQEHIALLARDRKKMEEWQSWQKARLVPEQLYFPGKNALKRRRPIKTRWLWLSGFSAAATLTLLFFLLRTESLAPEIAEAGSSESPPRQEEPVVIQTVPAVSQKSTQALAEKAPEEKILAVSTPELTQSPHERIQEERTAESNIRIIADEIEPRSLRIADNLSSTADLVGNTYSDRIERLPISPTSPKTSRLPMNELAELDRQLLFDEFTRENNISLLSVANAGIKGINKLTGSDISLMASRDEQGDVSGFRLKSKRFSVSRPLAQDEPEE